MTQDEKPPNGTYKRLEEHNSNSIRDSGSAREYKRQAQKLAQLTPNQEDDSTGSTQAAEAKFITPFDPVIETADGSRLPAIPVDEAAELNRLKDLAEGREPRSPPLSAVRSGKDGTAHGTFKTGPNSEGSVRQSDETDAPLREAIPPSQTNPLFPPLPMYGPPSWMRTIQCWFFRATSAVLSFYFLLAIVIGAIIDAVPRIVHNCRQRAMLQNPAKSRPFYQEETKRKEERRAAEQAWTREQKSKGTPTPSGEKGNDKDDLPPQDGEFVPTEGGPDPLVVDLAYYARRVGLDAEVFEVQTEDGFIIELWHLFNPRDYKRPPPEHHQHQSPDLFRTTSSDSTFGEAQPYTDGKKKYPVLMMHGLLQSAGAYCCNDDDSLAFYLAKSGYDVWLGNNRCGFEPKHTTLHYEDPRMWAWNIRQMGVMDLPALISRVLAETGFPKLALIAHSQGTTQTFVALAKEQRPDIGEKISVFCALAPAAYAGPLIGKIYFKVMQIVSPAMFRMIFGIHSFIPLMPMAHKILPPVPYSWMGYHVFSFLFSWSDSRWDRDLRNRMFQFAPTYVSSESMRWWLGRECFANQKCILATREEGKLEDKEDEEDDAVIREYYAERERRDKGVTPRRRLTRNLTSFHCQTLTHQHHDTTRGKFAWYDERFPPLALWVCGADDLVDGRHLLRRFDRGREPHVRVVHKKIIEGYEHLDVIWAMDAIEKVGKEVREVIWRTAEPATQKKCRVPVGCDRPMEQEPDCRDVPMMRSRGRMRMASISERQPESRTGGGSTEVEESKDPEKEQAKLEQREDELEEEEEAARAQLDETEIEERRESESLFEDVLEKANPMSPMELPAQKRMLGMVRE